MDHGFARFVETVPLNDDVPFEAVRLPILTARNADNRARWSPGERLHHVFEAACDRWSAVDPAHPAVLGPAGPITLRELDRRANRLARHLRARGVLPGARVAILLDRSPEAYVAIFAVLKAGAAYVPLDASFPPERVRFILSDSGATHAIVSAGLSRLLAGSGAVLVDPVAEAGAIAAASGERIEACAPESDALAYVIYTSGSTGQPKGVPIRHSMIVNFVRVATEVYGFRPSDRVYQGLTIAFDFSIEEIVVPLCAGAALVPALPDVGNLLGRDLSDFLAGERITALACVPTVLATLDDPLPDLRFILVSGEACPKDLVLRWWTPERVFLNAYGPTETTVTATIIELRPDGPVTIGRPLPTYGVAILHETRTQALPFGAVGEIGIAGIGVAEGYLNRPAQTAKAFVADTLPMPNNPSGRIYRTGDLGRITEAGLVEYLGRIDTQVKIRGYRIELSEIESVLMKIPAVAQAVVDVHEPQPGQRELAAFYTLRDGFSPPERTAIHAQMQAELPSYMVPAFLEERPHIPMLASGKADRKALPAPSGYRFSAASGGEAAPPRTTTEARIAAVMADILGLEQVSVNDHLFDDLGANSLLVARACARLRAHRSAASLSMRDVYAHPTVRGLATHLDAVASQARTATPSVAAATLPPHVASDAAYIASGAAQLAVYVGYVVLLTIFYAEGVGWVTGAETAGDLYLRSVAFQIFAFLLFMLLPVALKWLLVGRWTARTIPIWSAAYVRFWVVKTLLRLNPAVAFAGTPLFNLYLRLLGARIGKGAVVFSPLVPIATDLLSIGEGSVVHKDAALPGYRAVGGRIEIGPVSIGRNVHVGENSVVDIHTSLGDDCDLAHASTLAMGQHVPAGRNVHGCPAVETATRFRPPSSVPYSTRRVATFLTLQLTVLLLVTLPLPLVLGTLIYRAWPGLAFDAHLGPLATAAEQVALSFFLYVAVLVFGLAVVLTLPRLLAPLVKEDREYPLFGFHHGVARLIARLSNLPFYNTVFGDSSFILYYLRALGYRLSLKGQTGSNFGLRQKHDAPHLCEVGEGTMVSDGLSQSQFVASATSFRLCRTRIGAGNFLGNSILYPAGGRTGDNMLLATKVLVPVDGPVRANVGLLGSPAFEIPRSVRRDRRFDFYKEPSIFKERLALKRAANLRAIGGLLLSRWLLVAVFALFAPLVLDAHDLAGALVCAFVIFGLTLFTAAYAVFLERAARGFRAHTPQTVSIYDERFWEHERYWKLNDSMFFSIVNGTPFKNLAWRALGVGWGRKNFDDGCLISERSLVSVGDHCTFGEGSTLQSHSLEDGTFKSAFVRIGSGCTIGSKCYVSYGVTMEDGAVVDPDAFVMKGETLAAGARWGGNPARQMSPGG